MKTLIISDAPTPLISSSKKNFPEDATAEWESEDTLQKLKSTWNEIGFETDLVFLDSNFLSFWSANHKQYDLVHSVVEGWGSIARESWIPSLCELSGINFVGSTPFALSFSMKKSFVKQWCARLNIPTAKWFLVEDESDLPKILPSLNNLTVFIKPDSEGSGMGIEGQSSICSSQKEITHQVLKLLARYPEGILIEEYLDGEEFTSAMIGTPWKKLPSAKIKVPGGVYDLSYKSKEKMEEELYFNCLDSKEEEKLFKDGCLLAKAFGIRDFVRFDWKKNKNGELLLLEINPLAGLSYHYSVLPKMAEQAGISYPRLISVLANSALLRKDSDRALWYGRSRKI